MTVYADWSARGAEFLTPPEQHETEIRCYVRDPDGHLIEVGQTILPGGWRARLDPAPGSWDAYVPTHGYGFVVIVPGAQDGECGPAAVKHADFHDREDFATPGSSEPFAIMKPAPVAVSL